MATKSIQSEDCGTLHEVPKLIISDDVNYERDSGCVFHAEKFHLAGGVSHHMFLTSIFLLLIVTTHCYLRNISLVSSFNFID